LTGSDEQTAAFLKTAVEQLARGAVQAALVAASEACHSAPNESDMLMRNTHTGAFEIYDISNSQLTSAAPMGQVGLEWSVVGFGSINGAGSSDMLMRDNNNGAFEVYDITNNQLTTAGPMGQVGQEWSVGGIATDPPVSAGAQLAQAMASFAPAGDVPNDAPPAPAPLASSTTGSLTLLTHPQPSG